jgi:hypothetical protein
MRRGTRRNASRSFPVTAHSTKREYAVILAEDNPTPSISSKSFLKIIENYRCPENALEIQGWQP